MKTLLALLLVLAEPGLALAQGSGYMEGHMMNGMGMGMGLFMIIFYFLLILLLVLAILALIKYLRK